jgi:hypothetical protein
MTRTVILRWPPISAFTRVFDALWAALEGSTARTLKLIGRSSFEARFARSSG